MGKDDGSYNIVLLPGIQRETKERNAQCHG